MENNLITGPLNSNSVFDFSGSIANAPAVTNTGILQSKIRELADNKKMDDVAEFSARAKSVLDEFKNQTNEQLDFIGDDNDFSLNQISGFQGKLARLRNREAETLNDVFNTSLGIVQARETKRLIKEERKYQEKLLKHQEKWQLKNKAMSLGLNTSGSRKKLMSRIAGYVAGLKTPVASGGGINGGGILGNIDWGSLFSGNNAQQIEYINQNGDGVSFSPDSAGISEGQAGYRQSVNGIAIKPVDDYQINYGLNSYF